MINFKANEDILPLSEFRSNLAGYITQTRETGRPIIVTQEKLEKMEAYEDLLVAEGEADRGEVYTIEEVERMMKDHIAKHVAKQQKRAAI